MGHSVLWWASRFEHRTKRHRDVLGDRLAVAENYHLRLLDSPGYRKNVSVARVTDHMALARHFRRLSTEETLPDVIHCGFPPIELALAVARYGARRGVPVVMDARDLWPDIFADAVPRLLRPLASGFVAIARSKAREAFRLASAVSGHAPGFVDFGLEMAGRRGTDLDREFPFAYPKDVPQQPEFDAASERWSRAGVRLKDTTPSICFLGSFGSQRALDFESPIEAARILAAQNTHVRLVMCGSGPRLDACRRLASGLQNVTLPGWVGYSDAYALLRHSAIGLLPYLPSRDFSISIPNKAIEYLSASLPILTSLTGGYLDNVLRTAGCGVFYKGRDPADLARVIAATVSDEVSLNAMRQRAAALFERRYSPDRVYNDMAAHLQEVALESSCRRAVPAPRPPGRAEPDDSGHSVSS